MTVAGAINKLSQLNVEQTAVDSIEETKDDAIELVKKQLEEGVLSTGGRIENIKTGVYPYSKGYARKKASMGLQTSVVDLKLTGAYYGSLQMRVTGESMEYSGDTPYSKYLDGNYTEKILGLTDDNKATYTKESFFQVFKRRVEEITGFQF